MQSVHGCKILAFAFQYPIHLQLYIYADTSLSRCCNLCTGIFARGEQFSVSAWLYTVIFASTMSILWWLYCSLYQCNPGFIPINNGNRMTAQHEGHCQHCNCVAPLRSKHDRRTGRPHPLASVHQPFHLPVICARGIHPHSLLSRSKA